MRPALVLFSVLLVACASPSGGRPAPAVVDAPAAADLALGEDELTMEVFELLCGTCAAQIVHRSEELAGVTGVRMHLASKTLTVRFDRGVTTRERLISSVEQIVAAIQ